MTKAPKQKYFPDIIWDDPVAASEGDAESRSVYHAVGFALSTWETEVEERLFSLLMQMAGDKTGKANLALSRALGSIESNSGRHAALEAAAEVYFTPEQWKDKAIRGRFFDLMDNVRRAAKKRNQIAHGIVSERIVIDDTPDSDGYVSHDNVSVGFFLKAPNYTTLRNQIHSIKIDERISFSWTTSAYRYNSKQIDEFSGKFSHLGREIQEYANNMSLVNALINPSGS